MKQTNSRPQQLSVVMIIKEEEDNLPRALESVHAVASEIVIVDTGSTDRSVDIAQSYGAKVYHHLWEDSFAKHRNQSISYASGDWCLTLDADEELDKDSRQLLEGLMADAQVNGYRAEVVNVMSGGGTSVFLQPRLYRNRIGVSYKERMHNQIHIPGRVENCGLRINHFGYHGEGAYLERKYRRRLAMLEDWLKTEPDNWRAHYHTAQTYLTSPDLLHALGQGRHESAAPILNRVIQAAQNALQKAQAQGIPPGLSAVAYAPLVQALVVLGQDEAALSWADRWIEQQEQNPDPYYFKLECHFRRREWESCWQNTSIYLKLIGQVPDYLAANPHVEVFSQRNHAAVLVIWLLASVQLAKMEDVFQAHTQLLKLDDPAPVLASVLKRLRNMQFEHLADEIRDMSLKSDPGLNLE